MKRNEKIDVLRGWAIILVVFGHCMEYNMRVDMNFFL